MSTAHAGRAATGGDGGASSGSPGLATAGDDDAGGIGGEAVVGRPAERTFPLTRADVVRIAGTSFTTPAEPGGPICDDGIGGPPAPSIDYIQLAFVANASNGIDVIASTRGPWLNIQRSQLLLGESGYLVDPPPPTVGCMIYYFEDSYRPAWPTPQRFGLEFAGSDEHGHVTSLSVTARFEGEDGADTLTANGMRDVQAPGITEREPLLYEPSDNSYSYQGDIPSWSLPRHFEFSEALRPGWSIALENDAGDHFNVARSNGVELVPGFVVVQFYPPGFHWVVTGSDFAGNALQGSSEYRSSLPALASGSFESDDEGLLACDPASAPNLETCVAASVPGHHDVAALAGTRSLFVGSGNAALRILRTSNATRLLFRARLLDDAANLTSFVQALDAGSSASASQRTVSWSLDPDFSTVRSRITLPQDVSIKLPAGSADVLLSLDSSSAIWLDAVHTE